MRAPLRIAGAAAVFLAGLALAAVVATGGFAQDTTTTETATTIETTTEPTTVVQTETVEHTTTRVITRPAPTTTTGESSSTSSTPTWVWVLVAVLAVGLLAALIGLLVGRRGGGIPPEQRRRQLQGAVGSWVAQGWAVESETADTAVLVRGPERILVTVDAAGHVSSRSLQ
jgi:hypothetical protein